MRTRCDSCKRENVTTIAVPLSDGDTLELCHSCERDYSDTLADAAMLALETIWKLTMQRHYQ